MFHHPNIEWPHKETDNTKRRAGRAGGPCFQLNNMNFPRAGGLHRKPGPDFCLLELHIKAGRWAAEKPAGPPFCAARRPGPLFCVQPSEIQVFHLETQPSSPPTLQLVLSQKNLLICLVTPGSASGSTGACLWL